MKTFTACNNCTFVIVNNDDSHLNEEEAAKVWARLADLDDKAPGGITLDGAVDRYLFECDVCDVCDAPEHTDSRCGTETMRATILALVAVIVIGFLGTFRVGYDEDSPQQGTYADCMSIHNNPDMCAAIRSTNGG